MRALPHLPEQMDLDAAGGGAAAVWARAWGSPAAARVYKTAAAAPARLTATYRESGRSTEVGCSCVGVPPGRLH